MVSVLFSYLLNKCKALIHIFYSVNTFQVKFNILSFKGELCPIEIDNVGEIPVQVFQDSASSLFR